MNNWRLLLLAVVVVVQPIGSFTESNLIDGRECCEGSEDARLYGYRKTDERRSLDRNREDRRSPNDAHRLWSLHEIREERRYETIRGPMLTRSESLERSKSSFSSEPNRFIEHRLTREQGRRDPLAETREIREDQNRNQDESRNILGQNERDSRESRNLNNLDATRTVRVSRDARNTRSVERESENTMSRLPIRNSRSIEERRVLPNRDTTVISKREQEDIARSDTQRESRLSTSVRFDSRIQLDDNRERRALDRRIWEDGTEFRRSRSMDAKLNKVRAARAQRTVEQNERSNHNSRVVNIELRHRQDTEFGDKVSAISRESERTSAARMRESRGKNTRLARNRMEIRNNERIDDPKQRYENKRLMDTLRTTEERRLESRQSQASRSLHITTINDEQTERRSLLMLRESNMLSRVSERNTRNERAPRDRVVNNKSLNEQRQERTNNRISRDKTELRRIASRMDVSESSEEKRQQREVRAIKERQESRRTVAHSDVRESGSEERRQVNLHSKDRQTTSALREVRDTERMQESRRTVMESLEERMQQRKNAVRSSTDRLQESRRVSPSRRDVNFSKLDSKSRQNVRDLERSSLRRQVLQQRMEKTRSITRSISAERRNYARENSRACPSIESSRIREDTRVNEGDERKETRDHDRAIEHRVTRKVGTLQRLDARRSSRPESIRVRVIRNLDDGERGDQDKIQRTIVQRVTRNAATPQRRESRRSSRSESIRFENLVRNPAEIRDKERQEMQHKERDDDRTRYLSNHRSSERVLGAERRQNPESSTDSRKIQMIRNRGEVRSDRILAGRRQENHDAGRESRVVREVRNLDEVRSERMLAERSSANRDLRMKKYDEEVRLNDRLDSRRQRDATRDSRESSLQRESRDGIEQLTKSVERIDSTTESRINNVQRQVTRSRNVDAFRDTLVQDSEEPVSNWQMVFYTLQTVYICGLLMQMLTENGNKSKKRTFNWWSSPKNLIKVD